MNEFGELKEANTPDEMRKAFFAISHDNYQVRGVLDHAKYSGLSGEDTYVILAYNLLSENIKFKEALLQEQRHSINSTVFIKQQ